MNRMIAIIAMMMSLLIQPIFPQAKVEEDTIANIKRLAEQGNAAGQYMLGVMYLKGEGVPQNYQKAVGWWRLAAEQGYATAQFHLGAMYFMGKGLPQDYVQAHMWTNLSISRLLREFPSEMTDRIGELAHQMRDLITDMMTPEQIAKAQQLAHEWKPKGSGSQ